MSPLLTNCRAAILIMTRFVAVLHSCQTIPSFSGSFKDQFNHSLEVLYRCSE